MSALPAPAPTRAPAAVKLGTPEITPQLALPVTLQVTAPSSTTPAGNVSLTDTLTASEMPVFVTTMVYAPLPPGTYVEVPSVFVTASETLADSVSLSDALTGGCTPSLAVAVLTRGFVVMPAEYATGAVKVRELPPPALIEAPVAPKLVCPALPVTVPQLAVPAGTHSGVAVSVTPAGSGSLTVTESAADGPPLVTTTTVYVPVPPGV